MIELDPVCYSQIFPGCNTGYFSGTKKEFLKNSLGIVIYGKESENNGWRFINEWDLSAWVSNYMARRMLESEDMKARIFKLEDELRDIKNNSIKIDEEDFAYLLLKYKE